MPTDVSRIAESLITPEAAGAVDDHVGPESVDGMEKSSSIVTASNDQTASVWDIVTGEVVVTVRHDLELNSAVLRMPKSRA